MLATAALAQESGEETSTSANYWKTHFSLHGYATVGYADLTPAVEGFPTTDETLLGIESDGSFPYGNVALNLRYDPKPRHSFVLQLAAAELGDSPVDDLEDEVELDWLFYQGRLTENAWFRVGRHPVPVGIFNEVRDVGVLLPFFRPSYVFYREGALLSETVDGVAVQNLFFPNSPWNLEATAYYGEFDVVQQSLGFDPSVLDTSAEDAFGGQLWLSTPVSGLRFGFGILDYRLTYDETDDTSTDFTNWETWHASVDGEFDRFVARAEYREVEIGFFRDGRETAFIHSENYYFQLGYRATERLSFFFQPEYSDLTIFDDIYVDGLERFKDRRDTGYSVVFELSPSIVLRGEYHEVETEAAVDSELVFLPEGPRVRTLFQTFDSDYTILSVSVAF